MIRYLKRGERKRKEKREKKVEDIFSFLVSGRTKLSAVSSKDDFVRAPRFVPPPPHQSCTLGESKQPPLSFGI